MKRARKRTTLSVETARCRSGEAVLGQALAELGWKNVSGGSGTVPCDIYWRVIDRGDPAVPAGSYVARIPGISSVCHKVELTRHLERLRSLFPDDMPFYPRTWRLPEQWAEFEAQAHGGTFIVKPDGGSQGEGIFLLRSPRDLQHPRLPAVVQEYIRRPFLLHGLKFDLRVYVLVANLDPLQLFLSRSGMARFCTVPYQPPSSSNLHKSFMHLTNYSLNKRSSDYQHNAEGDKGSKQTLQAVLEELKTLGCDTEKLWQQLGDMVSKTMLCLLPQLMVEHKAFCVENSVQQPPQGFQLLGFDVLLDNKLRPILLEVNAHPSLCVDFEQQLGGGKIQRVPSPVDVEIKLPVVRDALCLVAKAVRRLPLPPAEGCYESLSIDAWPQLQLFQRCASLFLHFVGARGGLAMSNSAFRALTRHCGLCGTKLTNADVDILYIDVCRRNGSGQSSLSFDMFCQALLVIARRQHGTASSVDCLQRLLDHCERALAPPEATPTALAPLEATPTALGSPEATPTALVPPEATSTALVPPEATSTALDPTEATPIAMVPSEATPTALGTLETTPTAAVPPEATPTGEA